MKEALARVAFAGGCQQSGICALMKTAIDAMVQNGHLLPATRAQHALDTYLEESTNSLERVRARRANRA